MKPAEVSAKLRLIADTIDRSKSPQQSLVASDIKRVIAAVRKAGISEIRDDISHATDGPVTDFVLISRAMDAVQAGADPEDAANALYEELEARGFLVKGQGWEEPSAEY